MKQLIIVILLCICAGNGNAQAPITAIVQGELKVATGAPAAFVNIMLFQLPDSLFIKGGISEESGHFEIETILKAGSDNRNFIQLSGV